GVQAEVPVALRGLGSRQQQPLVGDGRIDEVLSRPTAQKQNFRARQRQDPQRRALPLDLVELADLARVACVQRCEADADRQTFDAAVLQRDSTAGTLAGKQPPLPAEPPFAGQSTQRVGSAELSIAQSDNLQSGWNGLGAGARALPSPVLSLKRIV